MKNYLHIIVREWRKMRSLDIEPVIYNKVYKIMIGVFAAAMIIAILYLFLLLTSTSEALTLRTLLIIIITFLLSSAIPYSSMRILDNAQKKDRNNALQKVAEQVKDKYDVQFKNIPSVNTIAIFKGKDGRLFHGVITLNNQQEPILKILEDYKNE